MIGTLNDAIEGIARSGPAPKRALFIDRRDLVSGAVPIIAPNYLLFRSIPPAPKFSIAFDSFVVQRVTTQRRDQIAVHYTNGSPLVDVFNTSPEIMTVAVTLPDTEAFYTPQGGGYLGESFEYLRALYDKYFRAAAAVGSKNPNTTGFVEFWCKGRVTRGYLIRYAIDRQATTADANDLAFDMFVTESIASNLRKARPEPF